MESALSQGLQIALSAAKLEIPNVSHNLLYFSRLKPNGSLKERAVQTGGKSRGGNRLYTSLDPPSGGITQDARGASACN